MPWFSGNTNSDSKGDSTTAESSSQSRTPAVWSTALCRDTHLPSQHSSMTSALQPASSHWISSGFHEQGMGSPSRESGDQRNHGAWRNLNVPSQCESPAALEPLPIKSPPFLNQPPILSWTLTLKSPVMKNNLSHLPQNTLWMLPWCLNPLK